MKALLAKVWLSSAAAYAAGLVGALSFGAIVLRPPAEVIPQFCIAFFGALVLVGGWRVSTELQRTLALRALSNATSMELPQLRAAHKELVVLADRSFVSHVFSFFWMGVVISVVGRWGDSFWSFLFEALLLTLTLGAVSALFGHVLHVPRMREGLRLLMERGLPPDDVVEGARAQNLSVRQRLIVFSAVGTMAPSLLVAQISLVRAEGGANPLGTGVVAALALFVGWVFVIAFMGFTEFIAPMRRVAEQAQRFADGDLREQPLVLAEDEVWSASTAFIRMRTQLMGAISQLQRAGTQISGAMGTLIKTSEDHGMGTLAQVNSLNQTSVTTEELARSALEIAHRAGSVAEIANKTLNVAMTGQATAETFFHSMSQMRKDNHAIADAVVKLNKRVQQIGKIVEFINEIADKSDLLALNAELEGTKAGEVGRGFSLVAAEMRRLAESVMMSTREIDGLINDIRDATNAAVMATEAGVKATDAGAQISLQVAESLKMIVSLARLTADAVQTISLGTQQQQTGTGQLAEAMASVLSVTQQGAAATQSMSAANEGLQVLVHELKDVVVRFRT